ncbi:unnamed protein product [Haemonchus placei]|uniref:Uncharacterized protein n=1 Tax=Haemonchus placei TaxID=6290 RepID=A0A3P8A2N1_HAEPC|nr:unnamed protein product [Haemonchus placei]
MKRVTRTVRRLCAILEEEPMLPSAISRIPNAYTIKSIQIVR